MDRTRTHVGSRSRTDRGARLARLAPWGPLLLGLAACVGERPRVEFAPLPPAAGISAAALQATVMDLADEHIAALGEAVQLTVRDAGVDARGRWLAMSFLRNGTGAAVDIGAGPNPAVALLDILVLSALQSWAFERHWIPSGIGETAGAAALARIRRGETAMWRSAAAVLNDDQLVTLRELVDAWILHNEDRSVVSLVRFDEFLDARRLPAAETRDRAVGLLAEVATAASAVEDATRFGERALWFAGRYPYILGQQAELTSYRIADQPELAALRDGLTALHGVGDALVARLEALAGDLRREIEALFEQIASERAATLTDLAERISAEREAAFDDAFARLAAERRAVIDDLHTADATARPLLAELRATVEASTRLASHLTTTADAFDRVLGRVEKAGTPQLDLTELAATARDAGAAAAQFTGMLDRLDDILGAADFEERVARLEAGAAAVADVLFWRVTILLVVAAGLGVAAGFALRARR